MNRICQHARKIQERWSAPAASIRPPEDTPQHITDEDDRLRYNGFSKQEDLDDNDPENFQCTWHYSRDTPPFIKRAAPLLRRGDCDACPCFKAIDVKIPGVRT